jgi:putative acetyltransferase
MQPLLIRSATTPADLALIRELFGEYQQHIGIDLGFQGFAQELAELPGKYAPPSGGLLLAYWQDAPAGCVALRPLEPSVCELKRLYVRPSFSGKGIGSALLERAFAEAVTAGYQRLRLDSLHSMAAAAHLYQRYGFYAIEPYNASQRADIYYLERVL